MLASPIRDLVAQRARIEALKIQVAQSEKQVQMLRDLQAKWQDPNFVAAQARARLHYVMPGEIVFSVIGLDGDGEANFENFKLYDQSLFLIVGSEGKGISRLVREKCDQILSIQITNKVESLNASVATAIALHQISSKR